MPYDTMRNIYEKIFHKSHEAEKKRLTSIITKREASPWCHVIQHQVCLPESEKRDYDWRSI